MNPKQHLKTIAAIAIREYEAKAKRELPVIAGFLRNNHGIGLADVFTSGRMHYFERAAVIWAMMNSGWTQRMIAVMFQCDHHRVAAWCSEARGCFNAPPLPRVVAMADALAGVIMQSWRGTGHRPPSLCCGSAYARDAFRSALKHVSLETGIPQNAILAWPHHRQIGHARRAVVLVVKKLTQLPDTEIGRVLHIKPAQAGDLIRSASLDVDFVREYAHFIGKIMSRCGVADKRASSCCTPLRCTLPN